MSDPSFQWRAFSVAVAATVAVIAAAWLLIPPVYLTNDDVAIRQGIEGTAFPGQPATGFLLMTHSALAWSVVWLQRVMPASHAWDLVVTATLIWALAALLSLAWTLLGRGWLPRATSLAAVLAATVPLIAGVQFTISATLAGGAAVALAATELSAAEPRKSVLVMAALLLVSGLLVRPMGATAGAVGVSMFLAPLAASERTPRAPMTHLAWLAGTTVALLGVLLYLDSVLYGLSQDWAAYHRYNWMLARLFEWGGDLPRADTDAIRASVGWSQNDWAMLQRWWGVDPDLHGFARVARAYETRATIAGWTGSARWLMTRVTDIDAAGLQRLLAESVPVLIVAAALVAVYANRRGAAATAVIVVFFCGFCLAIEAAFKELPFRLFAPVQACLLAAILITSGALRRMSSPLLSVLGLSLILTVLAQQTRTVAAVLAARDRRSTQVQDEVEALQRLAPSLVVIHSDSFPSEYWWRPFHRSPTGMILIQLAGNNQNPLLQRFLSDTGRQPLLRAMCEEPSLLVLSQPSRLEYASTSLREHFHTTAVWTEVYTGSFRAWRCTASPR